MKTIYHIVCIVLILVTGCSSIQKEFYSSGELKKERIYHSRDTSTYLEKSYFRNGQLKSLGNYVNGKREGIWQGWYALGDKYWEAEYIQGTPKPIPEDALPITRLVLSHEGANDGWYADTPQYLQVYVEGATPHNVNIACDCDFMLPLDTIDYNFSIGVIPRKAGAMMMHVMYLENGEYFSLSQDTIYVQPNPKKTGQTDINFEEINQVLLTPPMSEK